MVFMYEDLDFLIQELRKRKEQTNYILDKPDQSKVDNRNLLIEKQVMRDRLILMLKQVIKEFYPSEYGMFHAPPVVSL